MHAHKDYCYTSYDLEFIPKHKDIKYIIYQKEECPDTGRRHLQGYLELSKPMDFKEAKKAIFGQVHFEARRGPKKNAIAYCSKNETRIEGPWEPLGAHRGQGERNDLIDIKNRLTSGEAMGEIAKDHFGTYIRYHRGFEKFRLALLKARTEKPEIYIFWGNAGTGKTRTAYENHEPHEIYFKDNTKWWDSYEQQKVIIMDEFDWSWSREYILRVLDRYPMKVEIKGGSVELNSPIIYITCNIDPKSWCHWDEAIERRIKEIRHFE